jgi:hypothetical protein
MKDKESGRKQFISEGIKKINVYKMKKNETKKEKERTKYEH